MADILHDLPINAPVDEVFQTVSTPQGLDRWWTKQCTGQPQTGAEYELFFGPGFEWRAVVTKCTPNSEFELKILHADGEWVGTLVGFALEQRNDVTWIRFRHTGWPSVSEHYRISCNCWAMYLRILRRYLEHGESVPYELRLDA